MLSAILFRRKPSEVEGSTWEAAEEMKAHIHPGEQGWDSPGKWQVQGPSSFLSAAAWGCSQAETGEAQRVTPDPQAVCHGHQRDKQEKNPNLSKQATAGEYP